ncbi:hypothetical protein KPH14_002639 [Odynerus spinipes]|uniref:Transposase n=1 Tax=Odynerus spinipes TaxID=1348599 RepID=A0AAD9RGT0_9HYME|nr:hypothetical protein KPH14_002639 [Odynerus spinipes]
MAPVISEVTRGRIVGLWEADVPVKEIVGRTGCSENTVRRWIEQWQEGGEEALKDSRGNNRRPRITGPDQNDTRL